MTKEEIFALSLIKGVGNKTIQNMMVKGIKPSMIQHLPLVIRGRNKMSIIDEIENHFDSYLQQAEDYIEIYNKQGIEVITVIEHEYPALYRNIQNPPMILFARGNLRLLSSNKNVAIVGSRDCTATGYKIAYKTAQHFSSIGYSIVSGLAIGIDTAAHNGAIESSGKTIAIIPDVKKIYPKENTELANKIIEKDGLLIAENKPGSAITKGTFVLRDRLQSGLSLGVFVIESDVDSGTMQTVKYATEQQRPIFCPAIINDQSIYKDDVSQIKGIKKLLRENTAIPYKADTYDAISKMLEENERLTLL
jgi:DNA processing protein